MTDPGLKRLQEIFTYATENAYSDMYRLLYGNTYSSLYPHTLDIWQRIPPLQKETLSHTPFWQRTFIAASDIDYIRSSSGTSGKNLLVVPKTRLHPLYAPMEGITKTGILTFLQPQHQSEKDHHHRKEFIPVISGDPAHLYECTLLGKDIGINSLRTYPYLLDLQIPFLIECGLAETLVELILTGERISPSRIKKYAGIFPKARISLYYAAIEAQGVPGTASVSETTEVVLYSPDSTYYWELIDETGNPIEKDGIEGEILYTTLWTETNALPLIRYASGDLAKRQTEEDGTVYYNILGRKYIDRIKVARGELRVEEVERALKVIIGNVCDFELHHYTEGTPTTVLTIPSGSYPQPAETLARLLEQELKISPEHTYDFLVANGFHAPLTCTFADTFTSSGAKRKHFHVHE